ncbi:MAG: hypothetical protein Q8N14_04170, partial [Candidatus Omnitrophota bacterium]|nr:hypothetical protein [Candidatus Omnitrophota bacterium]
NIPAAVHLQSNLSDGRYSIEELARLAQENSVKVLILSDTLLRRWEYGLWPWRNLIKKNFEESSVIKFGVNNYLSLVEQAQKDNPGVLIIPAVEAGPFYYWKGSPFSKSGLSVYNWHKKMLVVGLNKPEDYRFLPVVANYVYLPRNWKDVSGFCWPALLIALGFLVNRFKLKKSFSFGGRHFSGEMAPFASLKYIIIAVGLFFLINNLTFSVSPYDSYHGEKGIKPYQHLIDYANKKGALVFWLHPESSYTIEIMGVKIITYSYKDDLLRAKDYAGFSGLYYDHITINQAGDLWDQILQEYCQDKRKSPVWVWGEVGYDGLSDKEINGIQTVLLLPSISRENVMAALREGKMYAKQNRKKNDLSLVRFIITDEEVSKVGFMGDDIRIRGKPRIEIRLTNGTFPGEEIDLRLIREGKIVQEMKAAGPELSWNFTDENCPKGRKTFYRLELESGFCKVLSNPIFVTSE